MNDPTPHGVSGIERLATGQWTRCSETKEGRRSGSSGGLSVGRRVVSY